VSTLRTLDYRRIENRMSRPFRISGYLFESMPSLIVELREGSVRGRSEAAGIYYLRDDIPHMTAELERVRTAVEQGATRSELQSLLPSGGARNGIDCAMWELESRRSGQPVWRLAGLESPPRPLVTTFTLSADAPDSMVAQLDTFPLLEAIKLKLDGDFAADAERVRAVRRARPDTWLGVDANQGYSADTLDALITVLADNHVALLEQPLRRGDEASLDGLKSPIPIASDESILDCVELEQHQRYFDVINIKLDKCGGLTHGLEMSKMARKMGKKVMVGNMGGASLSTAPAFVLGQYCDIVDLDGPWFLSYDPAAASLYSSGKVFVPPEFWGAA
jgi:L-Ala-D/L-Glu epimerase